MNLTKNIKKITKLQITLVFAFIFFLTLIKILFDKFFKNKPLLIKNNETIKTIQTPPQRLSHKTSCFSCEQDMVSRCGDKCAWIGQPTKSFDSETELVNRRNVIGDAYGAKTIKYY